MTSGSRPCRARWSAAISFSTSATTTALT
jgi:hypothetical protein